MLSVNRSYFENIPNTVVQGLSNGVYLGAKIYENIKTQEPKLFCSPLAKDIGTRLYSKSIQLAIVESLPKENTGIKHLAFGQHIAQIRGNGYLIHICYTKDVTTLPAKSKYKVENAKGNPGSLQLNLFSPPIAKDYNSLYYILAVSSPEHQSAARLLVPDENFEMSIDYLVLDTSALTLENTATVNTERKVPELARGVLQEYGYTKEA